MANPDLSRKAARIFNEFKVPSGKGFDWAIELESAESEKDLSAELQEFLANPYYINPKPKALEKHLSGQHDQSSHSGGKGKQVSAQPKQIKSVQDIPFAKNHFTKEDNPELREVIKGYTNGESYSYVNNGLRGPRNANHVVASPDEPNFVEIRDGLDKAMNLSPALSEPIQTFRGIPDTYGNTLEIGKTYVDKGFSSMSLDKKIADGFSPYGTTRTTLRMTIPKGQKVFVPNLYGVGKKSEKEIILPRSTPFKVTGIEINEYGKFIDVEVTNE